MAKGRLLIIEDEKDLLRLVEYALTRRGYEVHCVKDAEAGLKAFRRWNPALILLDLVLPGIGGAEFLARLRKMSAVKVILVSGRHGVDARALGADDSLAKPFTLDELCALVERVLGPSAPVRRPRRTEKAG